MKVQTKKVETIVPKERPKSTQSVKKQNPEIQKLISDLNRKFGTNAVQVGFQRDEDTDEVIEISRIPTGLVSLDIALGGGVPQGRYTQISGSYSSTKTTLALHLVREAQKAGLVCAFLDAEGTTDDAYLTRIGIETSQLLYSRPDGLEECTQMILDFQRSKQVHLAIFDSIEASPPTKEYESSMEDTVQMGVKQKLLGEFFRKYQAGNNRLVREGCIPFTLVALNQLREKIGAYGDPEYTPGGRAKDFTASVDLRLRRGDWITEGKGEAKEIVGQTVKFKIEKNKTFKRMQTGEIDFYFSENDYGIPIGFYDNQKSIIMEAVEWGLIERSGAWFYLDEKREMKFQGLDALITFFREHPEQVEAFRNKILRLNAKVDK